jgi:uncharacterized protein with GYD domain
MPKYLYKGSYSREGIAGVMRQGGTDRLQAIKKLAESAGGSLESFHFAFGSNDFYVIADLPDHAAALTIAGTVAASGSLSHLETVVLVSPEEIDAVAKRSVEYRPPKA